MNRIPNFVLAAAALLLAGGAAAGEVTERMLAELGASASNPFSAAAGEALWRSQHRASAGDARSCGSCHGADLRASGKHARTGKRIEALAPSANPKRLTERGEIDKWFLRNCKWTFGRECTAQEKGDLLTYLLTQ